MTKTTAWLALIVIIGGYGTLGYVLFHFISKFW